MSSAPPPFPDTPQRLIPFSRAWHVAKIVLRTLSFVLSITLLALGAASLASTEPQGYSVVGGYALALACPCLVWDSVEFITLCIRNKKQQRGVHPGAHVAIDLCLWLEAIAIGGTIAATASRYEYYNKTADLFYFYDEGGLAYQLNLASSIVAFLLIFPHVILWGRACRETHLRNKSWSNLKMVYVPNGGRPFYVNNMPVGQVSEIHPSETPAPRPMDFDYEDAPVYDGSSSSNHEDTYKSSPKKSSMSKFSK